MDIFKKVSVSEKKLVVRDLVKTKSYLTIKLENMEELVSLRVVDCDDEEDNLTCVFVGEIKDLQLRDEKIIVNFIIEPDRYYFATTGRVQEGEVYLKLTEVPFFSLQRRKNFRLHIPGAYYSHFLIYMHNGKTANTECEIKDVSAGGCKVRSRGTALAISEGDLITARLRMGKRNVMELDGVIRHVVSEKNDAKTFGVQFVNITRMMENRLYTMMIDLQRELFIKYSK